ESSRRRGGGASNRAARGTDRLSASRLRGESSRWARKSPARRSPAAHRGLRDLGRRGGAFDAAAPARVFLSVAWPSPLHCALATAQEDVADEADRQHDQEGEAGDGRGVPVVQTRERILVDLIGEQRGGTAWTALCEAIDDVKGEHAIGGDEDGEGDQHRRQQRQ